MSHTELSKCCNRQELILINYPHQVRPLLVAYYSALSFGIASIPPSYHRSLLLSLVLFYSCCLLFVDCMHPKYAIASSGPCRSEYKLGIFHNITTQLLVYCSAYPLHPSRQPLTIDSRIKNTPISHHSIYPIVTGAIRS